MENNHPILIKCKNVGYVGYSEDIYIFSIFYICQSDVW